MTYYQEAVLIATISAFARDKSIQSLKKLVKMYPDKTVKLSTLSKGLVSYYKTLTNPSTAFQKEAVRLIKLEKQIRELKDGKYS